MLAIDTEFNRRTTFFTIPSLLQCRTESTVFIVDLISSVDLRVISEWLADEQVTKVMHDCSQDLEVLDGRMDITPDFVFDTSIAYGFVTKIDSIGYSDAVQKFFDTEIDKDPRMADWLRRPVDVELLEYAARDVEYLVGLRNILLDELHSLDRYSWFVEEMQFVMNDYRNAVVRDYTRVRGARTLSCREQLVFRELFDWRDEIAKTENIPRNWVVHNDKLLRLARKDNLTKRDLSSLLRSQFEQYGDSLYEVLSRVSSVLHLQDRKFLAGIERRGIMDSFALIRKKAAHTHEISKVVLGSQSFFSAVIDYYAIHDSLPPWFGSWREQILGAEFLKVLSKNFGPANG